MSKTTEIREICGDYAFDVEYSADNVFTMFFNSLRNAQIVKRCIEVDDSVPNVATAVDFVEVVRCKDCRHLISCDRGYPYCSIMSNPGEGEYYTPFDDHFCSYGERGKK